MDTYTLTNKSDMESAKALLPSIKEHVLEIPNDVKQVIIKDSSIFIEKKRRRPLLGVCARSIIILSLTAMIIIGMLISQPDFTRAVKSIMKNEVFSFVCNSPTNSDSQGSMETMPVYSWLTNPSDLQIKQPDHTILYSMRNPFSSLGDFVRISSFHVARAGQTTLSFNFPSDIGKIYIADVSVQTSAGKELLVNGNFNESSHGWQGVSYAPPCYIDLEYRYCYSTAYKTADSLSQIFSTKKGSFLYITFRLRWEYLPSNDGMNVTIN
ncbi:unnamed protein product [Adineta ricciae]|uniref:Uncharacterized protein n=1 Tax=Adineta ricciae TaxID=249248 RepID=A0A814ALG3_ADIRI|nr:unnamed protein product [Adineta ricciae]CAF1116762.1 unnamed protein product [Adineta ricciae]